MDIKNLSIHKHNEYECLIHSSTAHGKLPMQPFELTNIFRLGLTKITLPTQQFNLFLILLKQRKGQDLWRRCQRLNGWPWKQANCNRQQSKEAMPTVVLSRKGSTVSVLASTAPKHLHTQCRSLQGNSQYLLGKGLCYLELFQALLMLWLFLGFPYPSGNYGKNKISGAQTPPSYWAPESWNS